MLQRATFLILTLALSEGIGLPVLDLFLQDPQLVIQGFVLEYQVGLLELLFMLGHELGIELLAETLILFLQGDLLAHQDLDIIFDGLALSELVEELLDLLLLKIDRLVAGVDLHLEVLDLLEQLQHLLVLLPQLQVHLYHLLLQALLRLLELLIGEPATIDTKTDSIVV